MRKTNKIAQDGLGLLWKVLQSYFLSDLITNTLIAIQGKPGLPQSLSTYHFQYNIYFTYQLKISRAPDKFATSPLVERNSRA